MFNPNRRQFSFGFIKCFLFSIFGLFKFIKREFPKKHYGFQFERKENLHYNYIKDSEDVIFF